jgi:hypothetical protein
VTETKESTSVEPAEHAGADSSSTSEPWFEPWQRMVLLSKTRSGKSTLEMVFAAHMTQQRIVLADVKCRYRMPGAFVVHGAAELTLVPADVRLVHFIPVAGERKAAIKEWDQFFEWCFHQTDVTVLLDECVPMPAPATGAPGWVVKYVGQAAVNRDGIIACSGRWRGLSVDLKAHSDVIGIFPGGLAADELDDAAKEMGEDLERAARELGCTATRPRDQLRFLLEKTKEVGPYAVLLYLRNQGRFVMFQLPADLVDEAVAFEVTP